MKIDFPGLDLRFIFVSDLAGTTRDAVQMGSISSVPHAFYSNFPHGFYMSHFIIGCLEIYCNQVSPDHNLLFEDKYIPSYFVYPLNDFYVMSGPCTCILYIYNNIVKGFITN